MQSGQVTIFDSRTGKPLRPVSRGEQNGEAGKPEQAKATKAEFISINDVGPLVKQIGFPVGFYSSRE